MKERPILFNGSMVRALLDGSKTQTRRIMKPQPQPVPADYAGPEGHRWPSNAVRSMVHVEQELQNKSGGWGGLAATCCPLGRVGDRLWVRETWAVGSIYDSIPPRDIPECGVRYAATDDRLGIKDRPSIHMPRWVSRITLEVTGVRVERLHDITDDDCIAEGCAGGHRSIPDYQYNATPSEHYRHIWKSTGGNWEANPWVWVIEFRRIEP